MTPTIGNNTTIQKFNHEEGCDCPIVNPITEWVGGRYVTITGYECPKCKAKTPAIERKLYPRNSITYTNRYY